MATKIVPGFGATDVGCRRKRNQDCFAAFPEIGLWVLVDGMGGHVGGAQQKLRPGRITGTFKSWLIHEAVFYMFQ